MTGGPNDEEPASLESLESHEVRPPESLSVRQQSLLDAVHRCFEKTGQSPTVRELMLEWGQNSFNGVYQGLRLLARKGHIDLQEGQPRGVTLLHRRQTGEGESG